MLRHLAGLPPKELVHFLVAVRQTAMHVPHDLGVMRQARERGALIRLERPDEQTVGLQAEQRWLLLVLLGFLRFFLPSVIAFGHDFLRSNALDDDYVRARTILAHFLACAYSGDMAAMIARSVGSRAGEEPEQPCFLLPTAYCRLPTVSCT